MAKTLRLVEALNREGAEYMVFGGAALNLHGLRRTTDDVDFFVSPNPENVARIKRALHSVWNDESIDEIQDDDMISDYPSVNYNPPGEGFSIDLVSPLGTAFAYEDLEAEIHTANGIPVRIASPRTLVRMKKTP
jgi:hypothetical protein